MNWFTWLSKTSLEPTLAYEYAQAFTHNELEEEDIAYFNHEFLQSMGISIAKHRLEIIKLARKGQKHPISKLLLVLKKTKKSLTKYIARLIHGSDDDGKALIVFPNKNKTKKNKNKNKNKNKLGALSYSSRWRRSMMIRNNKKLMMVNNQEKLRLTNGDYFADICDDSLVVSSPRLDSSSLMYDLLHSKGEKVLDDHDDGHWTPSLEEIKWDTMFKDLKPT